MAELGELVVRLGADTRNIRKGLDRAEKRMDRFGDAVKRIGIQLVGAFGAVQIARGIISTANAFDEARRVIVRSTGATGDALKRLDREFKNVLGRVPEDAAKVAAVFARLSSQTDATGETLQKLTQDILDASRVMGEDAVQTTTLFTRVLQQWQVPAEQASGLLNRLFVLSQRYGVGLSQLNNLVVEYGAVLTNAGFSLLETAELQARLTQAGINWTRIGPGINAAFRKWAGEGKDLREELGRTITKIKTATTETKGLAIASETFGAEGASRLNRAIRQGVFAIDDLGKSLKNVRGEIERTAKETETLGERWGRFINRMQLQTVGFEFQISDVFKSIIDVIEAWFTFLTGRADAVFEFLGQKVDIFRLKLQRAFTFSPGALAELDATIAAAEAKLDAFSAKLLSDIGIFPAIKPGDIDLGVEDVGKQLGDLQATASKWTGLTVGAMRALWEGYRDRQGEIQSQLGQQVQDRLNLEFKMAEKSGKDFKKQQESIRSQLLFAQQLSRDFTLAFASDERKKILAIEDTARVRRADVESQIKSEQVKRLLITAINDEMNRAITQAKEQAITKQMDLDLKLSDRFEILGKTGLARRLTQIKFEQEARTKQAEKMIQDVQLREEAIRNIERAAQNDRTAALQQFGGFWQQQLQQLVESNVFSLSTITTSFASATAQWAQGVDNFRQFFQNMLTTMLTATINFVIQWIAQQALATLFGKTQDLELLASHTATETAKTAITATQEAARTAIGTLATKAMLAGMAATLIAAGAMASAMIAMMFAVGQMAAVILFMIGVAMASNPFTAGFAGPTIAAATALSFGALSASIAAAATVAAAVASGVAALTTAAVIPLAHGGIVTGPTLALLGEAGPEAVTPLPRDFGGLGELTIIIMSDSRETARTVLKHIPRVVRLKLGNAI